jgi:hypothetical protein
MRMMGPLCVSAIFIAALWASRQMVWAETAPVEGLDWKGQLSSGKRLSIRNLNGSIHVLPATGGEASVRAEVKTRRSDPKTVRFDVRTDDRGIVICALWPGMTSCDGNGNGNGHTEADDIEVVFEARLPAGAGFDGATVNGAVEVRGASAAVTATSVNGDMVVETSAAPLRVDTVNGKIDVRLLRVGGDGDIRLGTVNGDIHAQVPSGFDAEVSARTVSGRISILGKEYQERVRTTVGRGGRKMSAHSVNGIIAIR